MSPVTQAARGRYSILCPVHARMALEDVGLRVCPVGGHRLARWWVYDGRLRRVVGQACEERGHELEIDKPLGEVPRLPMADVCMTEREKERAMPRGIKGSGPAAVAKKRGVIECARFEAGDSLLRIALVRHMSASESSWRVTWETRERGSKEAERGTSFAQPVDDAGEAEVAARRAYEAAALEAKGYGWTRTVGGVGQRLVIKPVPAPPKGAVRKGSKAA